MASSDYPPDPDEMEPTIHTNVRTKQDKAWKYGTEGRDESGKKFIVCIFCEKILRGGGINRLKQHQGGVKGNIAACKKVPADVKFLMKNLYEESQQKNKSEEVITVSQQSTQSKRKASSTSENQSSYFPLSQT
ncbi:putative transcription factor/ chromatin remodeling BED-type(Zn) family [Helianthus anomalus]